MGDIQLVNYPIDIKRTLDMEYEKSLNTTSGPTATTPHKKLHPTERPKMRLEVARSALGRNQRPPALSTVLIVRKSTIKSNQVLK